MGAGSISKWAGVVLLLPLLTGCNLGEENSFIGVSPLPVLETRDEDQNMRVPQNVARSFGSAYSAPDLERKLASVMARLKQASERPNLRYSVTILNSANVNAFALPDGQIFVTRGILALANDEAELAAVLAHEMAHVEAQHTAARMEQAKTALLVSKVVSNVIGDQKAAQASLVSSAMSLASFSRQQELEADKIGIGAMAHAGFDPYGAARLLENMDRYAALKKINAQRGDATDARSFLLTHPSTPERVAGAVLNARQWNAPGIGDADKNSYLALVDGMVYDDDPTQGVIRGRRFTHPRFGFSFTAPEGFVLENTNRAVLGVAQDGRAFRFDTVKAAPSGKLADALAASAVDDLKLGKIEPLEINGLGGVTTLARSPGWVFRIALVRHAATIYRFIFVLKQMDEARDAAALEAAKSFHAIAADDTALTRPYRIRIIQAQGGDTPDSLSGQMAGDDLQLERFLVLNGLDRSAVIAPGAHYKIVSDERSS